MIVIKVAAGIGAALLVGLVVLFFGQRTFLYPMSREVVDALPPGYEFVYTRTTDKIDLRSAYRPAAKGKPTLMFFHGNGDNIAGADVATRAFADQGYGVFLVEYRGYNDNPGLPDEPGFYFDGEASLAWLAAKGVAASDVALIGNSIGSGPATEMALRYPVKGLILISGFTSLPAVVADLYPRLPVRRLVRDKFESTAKFPRIKAPILLLHGEADQLIAADHSRKLAARNRRATLALVPKVGHELAYLPVAHSRILHWLSTI
jgi:uncharacterized protein